MYLGHAGGGWPSSPSSVGLAGSRQSRVNQTRKISMTVKTAQPGIATPKIVLRAFEASSPSIIVIFGGCFGESMVGCFLVLQRKWTEDRSGVDGFPKHVRFIKEDKCCVAILAG